MASSVCLVDSDFRTYVGQNLSQRFELDFDRSRQISLERDRQHRNLSGNLISASLAASSVWSVDSELILDNIYSLDYRQKFTQVDKLAYILIGIIAIDLQN